MIKKCKQCGAVLTSDENNNMCKLCREKKTQQRVDIRNEFIAKKKKKVWKY